MAELDPRPLLMIGEPRADYTLIDSGGGRKFEAYGPYRFIRPEPQAMWPTRLPDWDADGAFIPGSDEDGGGRWQLEANQGYYVTRNDSSIIAFRHNAKSMLEQVGDSRTSGSWRCKSPVCRLEMPFCSWIKPLDPGLGTVPQQHIRFSCLPVECRNVRLSKACIAYCAGVDADRVEYKTVSCLSRTVHDLAGHGRDL